MLIKICGITRAHDAKAAVDLGVHALGFVLWTRSPRTVSLHGVAAILATLPPLVTPVGVFVNPSAAEVADACKAGIRVAQVHGHVPSLPDGMALVQAARLSESGDGIEPAVRAGVTVLLDAHDPVRQGGTGRTIDWTRAAKVAAERSVILAGGLTPENVGAAIRTVKPVGVDVSSGVEQSPGVKDSARLAAFVAAVRAVA